jgi:uncharacterized protein YecE (DUF72 family)
MKIEKIDGLRIGACSWNYDSWMGLVYTEKKRTAAEYLREYSGHFNTVEIDSWFYKIPERAEVLSYLENVDRDFVFTCKVPERITLTHDRRTKARNPDFLSRELFETCLDRISPMAGQIGAVLFEFEYLNKEKMTSLDSFLERLHMFFRDIACEFPLAIEPRNANFLQGKYFSFLKEHGLSHVFSEKIYMPPIQEVYEKCKGDLKDPVILRLLGGDRKAIEEKTNSQWNSIVEPKESKREISRMTKDLKYDGRSVIINVNNHFEGSAPLTIESLTRMLKD